MSVIALSSLVIASLFLGASENEVVPAESGIKWYSWEEAVKANKSKPKLMFVDVYTDWCGWCKRMDQTTFLDKEVIQYLNTHFYPVKLNAEQRGDIQHNGQVFQFRDVGRRGVHELAYSLLDGRLGYPSYVYLNEKQERLKISPGYKDAANLLKELKSIAKK